VNGKLETAVNLGWTASKNETTFGIGCKYALDKDAWVRAKVNNSSQVGLGYQQRLRDGKKNIFKQKKKKFFKNLNISGVTLSLSTLIDGKNFQQGGHKVGMALELEA
jgi:voltage-dependent anion channel protein 2